MSLNRNANAGNSLNELGPPLAHDSIGTRLHGVKARSNRFLHRRDLGEPDAKCHERIRSRFANRDSAGWILWVKLDLQRVDSSFFRCRSFAGRKRHGLGENRFALQALKMLDGVIASGILSTHRHDPVQPTLMSISGW